MKLSEIMVSDVAEYVREEEGEPLLPHILEAARRYVRRVEEEVGVPLGWLSVGPRREQYIRL